MRPCIVSSTMPLYMIIVAKKVLGRGRRQDCFRGLRPPATKYKKLHMIRLFDSLHNLVLNLANDFSASFMWYRRDQKETE